MLSLSTLAQQPVFLTNGMVAYYPFNGDAMDASGNGNDGITKGVTFGLDRFSVKNKSASFLGNSNSYIQIKNSRTLTTASQLTISGWIKTSQGGSGNPRIYSKGWSPNSAGEIIINRSLGNSNAISYSVVSPERTKGNGVTSIGTVTPELWAHIVFTDDGNRQSCYINGSLDSFVILGYGYIPTNSMDIFLGRNSQNPSDYYQGSIDDVRIYNRALSGAEVAALHQYESVPQRPDPRRATADATVVNGFVVGATITGGGNGYINVPKVVINDIGGGTGATAIATIDDNGSVNSIKILSTGSGYTGTATIAIDPPPFPPSQAKGTAATINGFVTGVIITDTGHGYEGVIPPVTFLGGGGSGAKGTAIVNNGMVTGINMTASGSGYTNAPYVLIAAPPGLASADIAVHSVDVTLHLIPGYSYKIQTTTDAGTTWVDVESGILAVDATLVRTFTVTATTQLFRVVQVN